MAEKPKILKLSEAARSRFFTIEGLDLQFHNGNKRYYERIRGPLTGAVMIVPLLDINTMLLIREYAAGVNDYILGFPKGAIEIQEDIYTTANRELMEEVGYGAKEFMHLGRLASTPGYSAAMMDLLLAKGLYEQSEQGDEPESIEVVPWKISKIDELMLHPEFYEARSIAALFMLMRNLHGK